MASRSRHAFLDLDGTLLSASLGFRIGCLGFLVARMAPVFGARFTLGICRKMFRALLTNSRRSGLTNYERLIGEGMKASGLSREPIVAALDKFYDIDFPKLQRFTWPTPGALDALRVLSEKGWSISVVTNPIWPLRCVEARIRWAGLEPSAFTMITHSEIMRSCKPRAEFYFECLDRLGLEPSDAIMFGNDAIKDGSAELTGIPTVLLKNNSWPAPSKLEARLLHLDSNGIDDMNGAGSAVDDDLLAVADETGHSRNI